MKQIKVSKILIVTALVICIACSIPISVFAASKSYTESYRNYACYCSLSATSSQIKGSFSASHTSGAAMNPIECSVYGFALDENGIVLGTFSKAETAYSSTDISCTGISSVYQTPYYTRCSYRFMDKTWSLTL